MMETHQPIGDRLVTHDLKAYDRGRLIVSERYMAPGR